MKYHLQFPWQKRQPVFAPEDETGGGDTGGQQDTGAGTDMSDNEPAGLQLGGLMSRREQQSEGGEGQEAEAGQETNSDPSRPEHIPEKFWKDGEADLEGMAKAYTELEKAHGKLKRDKSGLGDDVPENAAGYFPEGLELGDDVKNLTIEGPDDPGLKAWGEVCHKYGIGKELGASLARDMFGIMDQYAPEAIDPDVEMEKLGKNGKAVLESVFVWADGAHQAGKLSESDVGVMNQLAGTADGVKFLANMRAMSGEERVPVTDVTTGRHMTVADWDNQFKQAVKDQNYAEQERLEKLGEELFGTEKSHGSTGGAVDHMRKLR